MFESCQLPRRAGIVAASAECSEAGSFRYVYASSTTRIAGGIGRFDAIRMLRTRGRHDWQIRHGEANRVTRQLPSSRFQEQRRSASFRARDGDKSETRPCSNSTAAKFEGNLQ
jgi:hypothetical protein